MAGDEQVADRPMNTGDSSGSLFGEIASPSAVLTTGCPEFGVRSNTSTFGGGSVVRGGSSAGSCAGRCGRGATARSTFFRLGKFRDLCEGLAQLLGWQDRSSDDLRCALASG